MKTTIFYADAHAGSGKTHSAHNYIKKLDGQATIATQTNLLSDQQCKDLAKIGVKARVISGRTVSDFCTKQYVRHCADERDSVAIINQNLVKQLLEAATYRHLFVDEIFSPVEKCELVEEISASWEFISNLVSNAVETEFDGVLEILSTDNIKEIAEFGSSRKSSMTALPHVREFCQWVDSEYRRVFVLADAHKNFQSNIQPKVGDKYAIRKKRKNRKLTLYAWLQPSVFGLLEHPPTLMGANFPATKLFLYWNSMVNFVPHPEIKGVRYDDFAHKSPHVDIRPCSETHLSGRFLHEKVGYDNFCDSVADAYLAEYGDVPHLATLNANQDFNWKLKNGTELPANPMGLNDFMDRYHAIHLATLYPSNEDCAMWKAVAGVTKEQLVIAQAYEMMYQFLTRSAIRDGADGSEEPLVFIVLDRQAADYLCEVFGVAKSGKLFNVPALTNYTKPKRKTRSDKKPLSVDERKERAKIQKRESRARIAAQRERTCAASAQPPNPHSDVLYPDTRKQEMDDYPECEQDSEYRRFITGPDGRTKSMLELYHEALGGQMLPQQVAKPLP
ncbi:hypothetical protein BTE77_00005 [Ensifer adhaerens]|nr:hypothetical protein BTE77_00005 [Ensifer adhaerens]